MEVKTGQYPLVRDLGLPVVGSVWWNQLLDLSIFLYCARIKRLTVLHSSAWRTGLAKVTIKYESAGRTNRSKSYEGKCLFIVFLERQMFIHMLCPSSKCFKFPPSVSHNDP